MNGNRGSIGSTDKLPAVVLASSSRYRRAQMEVLNLDWTACDPTYREEHDLDLPPEKLVVRLALEKALSAADSFPDSLIVGSDQALVVDGELVHKPSTAERACAQLEILSGREHCLMTSVVVHRPADGRTEWDLDVTLVRLRRLSPEVIQGYVTAEQPLDCVGALKLEGFGVTLVESISGDDPTAVIGLPLVKLVTLLRKFGLAPGCGTAGQVAARNGKGRRESHGRVESVQDHPKSA